MKRLAALVALVLLAGCDKLIHVPLNGTLSLKNGLNPHQVVGAGQSNMWYMNLAAQFAPYCHTNVETTNIAIPGTALSEWVDGGQFHNSLISTLKSRRPAVMLWWQGETDAYVHVENTYAQRFTQFILDTRRESGLPDLTVIFVQLGEPTGKPGWDVMQMQQAMVHLPGVYMVVSNDVQQDPDHVHYVTSGGYDIMGKRLADEFNEVMGI